MADPMSGHSWKCDVCGMVHSPWTTRCLCTAPEIGDMTIDQLRGAVAYWEDSARYEAQRVSWFQQEKKTYEATIAKLRADFESYVEGGGWGLVSMADGQPRDDELVLTYRTLPWDSEEQSSYRLATYNAKHNLFVNGWRVFQATYWARLPVLPPAGSGILRKNEQC